MQRIVYFRAVGAVKITLAAGEGVLSGSQRIGHHLSGGEFLVKVDTAGIDFALVGAVVQRKGIFSAGEGCIGIAGQARQGVFQLIHFHAQGGFNVDRHGLCKSGGWRRAGSGDKADFHVIVAGSCGGGDNAGHKWLGRVNGGFRLQQDGLFTLAGKKNGGFQFGLRTARGGEQGGHGDVDFARRNQGVVEFGLQSCDQFPFRRPLLTTHNSRALGIEAERIGKFSSLGGANGLGTKAGSFGGLFGRQLQRKTLGVVAHRRGQCHLRILRRGADSRAETNDYKGESGNKAHGESIPDLEHAIPAQFPRGCMWYDFLSAPVGPARVARERPKCKRTHALDSEFTDSLH